MPEFLTAKSHIPILPAQHLFRPRLVAGLDACLAHPVTLVSAPPGFGKTMALAEWLGSRKSSAEDGFTPCWLSLDEHEDSPALFWQAFASVLERAGCEACASALSLLQSPEQPPVAVFLNALLNGLSSSSRRWVMVLDDIHFLEHPDIHAGLAYLIDNLPASLRLILAGRMDPPLPLARWRAQGRLLEIRAADLRFTLLEAQAFLQGMVPAILSDEEVSVLEARTEGWITGLQLAALSLRQQADPHAFIQDFSGSHRFVIDYLAEEVLAGQPADAQAFMLQTCILDRMCGDLCDAVTEGSDGQRMLERLEKSNLFVFPMDENRQWYRYHHLFADLLRNRLGRTGAYPDADLHLRAAGWLERAGFLAGAVTHALAAGEADRAAGWVRQQAPGLMAKGEMELLRSILVKFDPASLRTNPWLSVYQAWVFSLGGRSAEAIDLLPAFEKDPDPSLQAYAGAIRAYDAFHQGQVAATVKLAREALDRLPADETLVRSLAHFLLGMSALMADDLSAAESILQETVSIARRAGNIHIAMPAERVLAQQQIDRGNLHQAIRICRAALALATDSRGEYLPVAAEACGRMGLAYYEQNRIEEAGEWLERAVRLAEAWGNTDSLIANLARWGWVLRARGDIPGWRDAIKKLEALSEKAAQLNSDYVRYYLVRSWLAEDRLPEASAWADRMAGVADPQTVHRFTRTYEALARVRLAESNPAAAAAALDAVISWATGHDLKGRLIPCRILQARIDWMQARTAGAMESLRTVLEFAQPDSWVRPFLDEGPGIQPLLENYLAHPPSSAGTSTIGYASLLLDAMHLEFAPGAGGAPAMAESSSPLTEREREILRLVAEGCTNQAIAERLVISLGTVKAHTASIYRKLDVGTRTQAIAKARSLKLL